MPRFNHLALAMVWLAGSALAGCQTERTALPLPAVTVSGPQFAETAFDCGKRPLEPDLAAVDKARQGSATLRYQNAVTTWAQRCQNRLLAVKAPLQAAGQVVGATEAKDK